MGERARARAGGREIRAARSGDEQVGTELWLGSCCPSSCARLARPSRTKGMDGRRDSARTRRMPAAPASPRSTRRPCPSPTATESTVVRFRWWRKAAPRSARLGAHCRRYGSTAERHAKSLTAAHRRDWKKRGTRRSWIASPIQEPARRARAAAEVTDRQENAATRNRRPARSLGAALPQHSSPQLVAHSLPGWRALARR